jgi:hypothetical protein
VVLSSFIFHHCGVSRGNDTAKGAYRAGSPPTAAVRDEHLRLVEELAGSKRHSGGALRDHLVGTARLLEEWGNPAEVCLAGLFHSIYGTEGYSIPSVELGRRDHVRERIGERAERLAYLFGVCERRDLFPSLGQKEPVLRDFVHGREVRVSHDDLVSLVEIEVANYLEFTQRAPLEPPQLARFGERVERARAVLTPGALRAARRYVAEASAAP